MMKSAADQQSKKKLIIKPFKSQPKIPENFELISWQKLQQAIHGVFHKISIDVSKEELYRIVEDLCIYKFAPGIYDKLSTEIQTNINQKVDSLLNQTSDPPSFLLLVDNVWRNYWEQMITIRNIFLYLDQSYALSTPGCFSIWDLGASFFRQRLEHNNEVEVKLISGIMFMIHSERSGQAIDPQVLHRIIRLTISLGIYKNKFELPFLNESRWYFQQEGQEMMNAMVDPAIYLAHVESRLTQANQMITKYLIEATRSPLIALIEDTLLRPHLGILISKGAPVMFDQNKATDLKRLYQMCKRIQMMKLLKDSWILYLRSTGESLIQSTSSSEAATGAQVISVSSSSAAGDQQSEKDLIEQLLLFQDKVEVILQQYFSNEEELKAALKSSFEYFININQSKSAEVLARYADRKLRGEKGVPDSEVEVSLEKLMKIFRYLQGKDLFEAFYKKHLSKRLLLGKSSNSEIERSMLAKMRMECGIDYTSKLDGMFGDIDLAKNVLQAYRAAISSASSAPGAVGSIETEIMVLTTSYWPTYPTIEMKIPPQISHQMELFSSFYNEKYQGRRLTWQHSTERCIVTARFPKGKKELELSLLQTVVVLCFNQMEHLSYQQIRNDTGITDSGELDRTLLSLSCGKPGTRILIKEPKSKEVHPSDTFRFDENYSNKLFRIKINTIQLKETVEEVEKTREEVFRDRQYEVDAIIVRLMKARKKLTHSQLMSEIFSQLKFSATIADIKMRIESLIEREYLERDRDDSSSYQYLA